MVGPLTMKLGTLMYHDESSSKQKLQACKQQQTASGNLIYGVCAYKLLVVGPLTMKTWYTDHHDKEKQGCKQQQQPQPKKTFKWCQCL